MMTEQWRRYINRSLKNYISIPRKKAIFDEISEVKRGVFNNNERHYNHHHYHYRSVIYKN